MHELDVADPLAAHRDLFVASPGVVAYLDGNSLGRPLSASVDRVGAFLTEQWGGRLIRGWDEGWLDLGQQIGDELGRVCLGAGEGQTSIGDSTTVLIYKLVRAAAELRPGRRELVVARDDFPTDRYVLEGITAERGLTLRWVATGADELPLTEDTAVVVLSHVGYRSGRLLDVPAITAAAHAVGALVVWDLCHTVGVVPTLLDEWEVDMAVGCTYKYLNGGPGSPAFAYVARRHLEDFEQPVQGWLGSATPFEMGQGYRPAEGIRRVTSGTPPVVGMLAMQDMIALIDSVGIDAVRAKSIALTSYAIDLVDSMIPEAVLATPRDARERGGHVTIDHPRFEEIMPRLWQRGVIPDFRRPTGIRLGLSPLSTSFAEVEVGVRAVADEL